MDEIRDTRRPDSLSRFLDSHIVHTNPFGRNSSGEKLYRRAERLVAALHLLTSHVQEGEPLRKAVRATGIKLLSEMLALRDELRIAGSDKSHAAQATIRELISLSRMLAVAGFISIQNAEVIVEAIDGTGDFLSLSQRTPLSESTSLSREDFQVGGYAADKRTRPALKDRAIQSDSQTDRILSDVKDITKDNTVQPSRTDNHAMNTRSREVLAALRAGGELGIRDISSSLPEYSEKMIQRELASLVASGQVKKTGLKRWSRYALVQKT